MSKNVNPSPSVQERLPIFQPSFVPKENLTTSDTAEPRPEVGQRKQSGGWGWGLVGKKRDERSLPTSSASGQQKNETANKSSTDSVLDAIENAGATPKPMIDPMISETQISGDSAVKTTDDLNQSMEEDCHHIAHEGGAKEQPQQEQPSRPEVAEECHHESHTGDPTQSRGAREGTPSPEHVCPFDEHPGHVRNSMQSTNAEDETAVEPEPEPEHDPEKSPPVQVEVRKYKPKGLFGRASKKDVAAKGLLPVNLPSIPPTSNKEGKSRKGAVKSGSTVSQLVSPDIRVTRATESREEPSAEYVAATEAALAAGGAAALAAGEAAFDAAQHAVRAALPATAQDTAQEDAAAAAEDRGRSSKKTGRNQSKKTKGHAASKLSSSSTFPVMSVSAPNRTMTMLATTSPQDAVSLFDALSAPNATVTVAPFAASLDQASALASPIPNADSVSNSIGVPSLPGVHAPALLNNTSLPGAPSVPGRPGSLPDASLLLTQPLIPSELGAVSDIQATSVVVAATKLATSTPKVSAKARAVLVRTPVLVALLGRDLAGVVKPALKAAAGKGKVAEAAVGAVGSAGNIGTGAIKKAKSVPGF